LIEGTGFQKMASATFPASFEMDGVVWESKVADFVEAAEQRRGHLLRLARRVTPCNEEAEDIVQEALLRAYRNLPRFRGEARMSTWLQAIVQNAAREWLREQKGRVLLPLERQTDRESVPFEFPDPGPTPEEIYEAEEMRRILRRETRKLSKNCRRAVQLCIFEETPQQTAARKLDVSVVAIKARIFTAKRLLRQAMRNAGSEGAKGVRELTR
jgi:RNA polymerase sigma-70 factor, ECF subfamily